jgi:DNA-binding NtrC family response regulator
MSSRSATDLAGKRVLVVEDEWLLAEDVRDALERCGAVVVGPAPDVDRAREFAQAGGFDCAVLDINLHGEHVFGLAREMKSRGQRFVFATGYGAALVPADLRSTPHFEKPLQFEAFTQAVARACER